MAGWITHSRIADELLRRGLRLDKKSFCIGNIAPDCNIEKEDKSGFIPSREVTHRMSEKNNKLTADYEGYYTEYVENRPDISDEERAFHFGYYAHLITDVETQRAWRDPDRVRAIFERIAEIPEMQEKTAGLPETMDTLKSVFGGRRAVSQDVAYLENRYLLNNPNSVYHTVVRTATSFPDYLDYLPSGAIPHKITLMTGSADPAMKKTDFIFYTEEEYETLIQTAVEKISEALRSKGLVLDR